MRGNTDPLVRQIAVGTVLLGALAGWQPAAAQMLPADLAKVARQHSCGPVIGFFERPGMIEPPYLYGYIPGDIEDSAAFWCERTDSRPRSFLLVLVNSQAASTCPQLIEWSSFPGGLSLGEPDTSLEEFTYVEDQGADSRLSGARTRYAPLRDYYDGVETLFYCHDGRWTYRIRH